MNRVIKSHPDIDVNYFTSARRLIDMFSSKTSLPIFYHKAHDLLKNPTHGKTALIRSSGFIHTPANSHSSSRMEGITKIIQQLFHPLKLDVSSGGMATGGASRGIKVDNQLANLINNGISPDDGKFNPYAILAMHELMNQKLVPFCAQYAISAPSLGIATATDILCIDESGDIVNVQLKTGFEKNYEKQARSGLCMMSPHIECAKLTDMPDTFHNRHRLQLIVEHIIVSTFAVDSRLLVVTSDTATMYPVDRDIDLMQGILMNIRKRNETEFVDNTINAMKKQAAIKKIMQNNKRKQKYSCNFKYVPPHVLLKK